MNVPFCLPLIDEDVVNEVNDALLGTGWLSTGPKVQLLQKEIANLCNVKHVLCVNSWTSGAMLVLKWFGVGPGDEVIIPAYTYSATALCAMNLGAKVVMVDVNNDFNINVENIKGAITDKTKAILPVDIGGWPCDYKEIMELVKSDEIRKLFSPRGEKQSKLGRMLVLSDAAHSIGSTYNNIKAGRWNDFTIFSLHSVKNVTAGEGGAICINLPSVFDEDEEYTFMKALALNGQTKSAFEKNQRGSWKYDIIDQGLKINMPDICAAIALAQIRKYDSVLLPDRKRVFNHYNQYFKKHEWAILPKMKNDVKESSCHLYLLRFENINESMRDKMITLISNEGVGVNVHYIPMAMLTLFKNLGYNIADYPVTFSLYENLITLPVYNGLANDQLEYVCKVVSEAYNKVLNDNI